MTTGSLTAPSAVALPGTVPEVSPLLVHRVGGLPVEALDVDLPGTYAGIDAETTARAAVDADAGLLAGALHELVPGLDARPDLRRAALALRRSVHNGRPDRVAPALAAELSTSLPAAAGDALARRQQAQARLAALEDAVVAAYERESAAATGRLRALLEDRALGQALALASPTLLRHSTAPPAPGTKAARSILGYSARAARKTSPFSHFTGVALEGVTRGQDRIGVSQQQVRTWLDELARDPRTAGAFEVEPNRSVVWLPDGPVLLSGVSRPGSRLAWRTDVVVHAAAYQHTLWALRDLPRLTVAELLDLLRGDAFATYLRLLDSELLSLVMPWRYGDGDPLPALADRARRAGNTHADACADALSAVAASVRAVGPGDGRERLAGLDTARRALAGSRTVTAPAHDAAWVYEDAASPVALRLGEAHRSGGPVAADLRRLGSMLRPYVFRSHLYDMVVDAFVGSFGPGGHCDDAYSFLVSVAARPVFGRELLAALGKDRVGIGQTGDRAFLPVSATSAPPAAAVLYQLAASCAADVTAGRYELVVNQFNPGLGGLVARFRRVLTGTRDLTAGLAELVAAAFPEAHPTELMLCAEVNGMHRDAAGALPPTHWPGEPGTARRPAGGLGLGLRHEAATGTLTLVDTAGRPTAPVYLGVVPAHLVTGPARLLLCLADPWVLGATMSCTKSPFVPVPAARAEVVATPAVRDGRLVLDRRCWRTVAAGVPVLAGAEAVPAYLRRLRAWQHEHGLPDEVFVSIESAGSPMEHAARKPSWLSFTSAHAVLAVLDPRHLATATAVRFAQALPGRDQHWARDDQGLRRVAEHVSFLRWERPAADGRP